MRGRGHHHLSGGRRGTLSAAAALLVAEEAGGSLVSAGSTLGPEVPPPLTPLPLPNGDKGKTFLLGWLIFWSDISQQ